MKFLKTLFKIPTPKELGRTKYSNALPMRDFCDDENEYCWEDYYEEIAEKFPVRNFLGVTLPKFIKYKLFYPIWAPYSTLETYLVSHLIPSRRYHMLDLRQPCSKDQAINFDCYRYGWLEVSDKMLYAMFNLLKEYLQNAYDPSKDYDEWEIENMPDIQSIHEDYQTAKAILYWWDVERKQAIIDIDNIGKKMEYAHDNRKELGAAARTEAVDEYFKAKQALEDKTEEMLIKIVKMRNKLWT
jgi:hypothetical protein